MIAPRRRRRRRRLLALRVARWGRRRGRGRLVPTIPPRLLRWFRYRYHNHERRHVRFQFLKDGKRNYCHYRKPNRLPSFHVRHYYYSFVSFSFFPSLQAVDHESGFIAGDTSFQIKRENGESVSDGFVKLLASNIFSIRA